MADASVRTARDADVPEIARIQLDTWRLAYARLVPPEVLDAVTPEQAQAQWTAAVTQPPTPAHHVLVAQERQWTVGFAAFGPADAADEPDDPVRTGVILTLLVEPRWGRRGHGSRLLAATVDHLRADGMDRAVVWILEGDRASAAFYESAGWERDGYARALDTGGQQLREIRLHTLLSPEPSDDANNG